MSFWEVLWLIIVSFAFVAYLMMLFMIVGDLFRDKNTSGWAKAVWIICLIFFPLITALVYLIARGQGMAERSSAEAKQIKQAQDSYIRETAGTSPAAQIADAKKLFDEGSITQAEFEQLKNKALA
ncbi:SHOCT domain-containing protein [Nocardia asteroides]|uniref:SHOCT domain-containing protein n=1 Tax=Nocardia asteroides TaxID=1824 RepID=UPI001E56BF16|nr:SHOCT domain-containing protein [Nocardia asteroides]UGT57703.1 SHOCT domain-containing protein [Nocardia asteroides]